MKDYLQQNNGSAVSFSTDGRVRFYSEVDLSTMKRTGGGWSTYFNLNSPPTAVLGLSKKKDVDFCCPQAKSKNNY